MLDERLALALVLLASPIAGCLGSQAPAEASPQASNGSTEPIPGPPSGYTYEWPPGDTTETEDTGVCVRRIVSRTKSLQEPYLAIHPTNPDVMAIGVNEGRTVEAVDPTRSPPGADVARLGVFVTEDGGETWEHVDHPVVREDSSGPAEVFGSGDPALAWDANGTLHVSGIVTAKLFVEGFEIFYTSTSDRGDSWSNPHVFTDDEDNDRNWINVGPSGTVYVPWQNLGSTSEVAWSSDGEASWQRQDPDQQLDGCRPVGPLAFHEATPYLVCSGNGTEVHRFDPATGDTELVSQPISSGGTEVGLRTLPNGSMVALSGVPQFGDDIENRVLLARSAGGPTNWSEPVNLLERTSVDDGWDQAEVYWWGTDPWGGFHLILSNAPDTGALTRVVDTKQTAHVVVDPADWTVIHERLLSTSSDDPPDPPRSPAPTFGDHFFGMDFTDDAGFIVWTEDRALEMTTVTPEAAGASPTASGG